MLFYKQHFYKQYQAEIWEYQKEPKEKHTF